jgi:hypothetical protein
MGSSLGGATWKLEAVGAGGGAATPRGASLPPPSAWQFVVGPGAQPCQWLA